jgi:hypothetical protein
MSEQVTPEISDEDSKLHEIAPAASRKIRRLNLGKQLRPGKRARAYFLVYSIELLVVMIGIAAGFAVNNYAEHQRELKLEADYMANLHDELSHDIENLMQADSINNLKIDELTRLLIMVKMNDREQIDSISRLIKKASEEVVLFYPSKTTYESIKQGGHVNLIRDFQIKNQLIGLYENEYEKLATRQNIILTDIRDRLQPFVSEYYDIIEFQPLNQEAVFSYRFTNLIQQMIENQSQSSRYYKESLAKCRQMLRQLETKIKN